MRRFVRWLPVLILIPLWGSGLVLDRIAERVLLDSVHERMVTALHAHRDHMLTMLAHQQRGLKLFTGGAVQALAEGRTPRLDTGYLTSLLPEVVGCVLLDAERRPVTRIGADWPPLEEIATEFPPGAAESRVTDPQQEPTGLSVYDVYALLKVEIGGQPSALSDPQSTVRSPQSAVVGTLACRVKNILSQELAEHRQGLGLTGKVYLVSAKTRLMLTESRFIPNAIGRVKVDTIGVREALKMRNGLAPYPDYRGIPVIGAFLYLRDYGWVLLAEMDEAEALAPLLRMRMVFGLSLGLISVAAGVVGWRYGRQLSEAYAEAEKARDVAKEAEAQARALLRSAVDAIFEIDESGTIMIANESAHRMFGWPSGELIGQKITALMLPEDVIKYETGFRRYLETGKSSLIGKCVAVTGLRRDGSRCPCELSVAAITLPDGRRRFISVLRDTTERLQMESRNRMLAQAMRTAMDGIVLTDPQAVIIETNPAFDRMFGYERGELIGRHVNGLYPPAWLEKELPAIVAATRETGWTGEVFGLRKDGSTFTRWVSTSPIRDPEGRLIGMLSVSRDITERKTMETQARRLEQLAAMGQLLGGISHEMKNPLFVLTGRLHLLKEKLAHQEYDAAGSDLQKIEDAAQRMTKIAQRFLFLAALCRLEWVHERESSSPTPQPA
jgi:PAS domain S-box-containing protein